MIRLYVYLLAICCVFGCPYADAQQSIPEDSLPPLGMFATMAEEAINENTGLSSSPLCDENCFLVRAAMTSASIAEMELVTSTRSKAFNWHHSSTVMIFWLVAIVVMIGLGMSAWQFIKGGTQETSSFKVSLTGIEASSSGIGLLMFIFSIAFFYLYLIYVYPLHEIAS